MHVKGGVKERETSLALLRPGAGLKQDFEVRVKCLLPWNEDPHIDTYLQILVHSTSSSSDSDRSHTLKSVTSPPGVVQSN